MHDKLRLVLLISGGGTTAFEIIRACKSGRLGRVWPVCVVASKKKAAGINLAQSEDVDTKLALPRYYESAEEFGSHIIAICRECRADMIGLYGWLPKIPPNVIEAYAGKMINQHPGPLDPGYSDFGGKGMHGKRVHAARLNFVWATKHDFWTEATAQRVDPEYDLGAILHKEVVQIRSSDDPTALQQRVLPVEHRVQIETLEFISDNRVTKIQRDVRLVKPDEESILIEAKRAAGQRFPNG